MLNPLAGCVSLTGSAEFALSKPLAGRADLAACHPLPVRERACAL